MSNVVNFSGLKRKEIKCIIFENVEGKIVVENNSEKIKNLIEKIESPIIIYNPNKEQRIQIQKIISGNIFKDKKDIEISPEDLILDLLPLTSNIILDLHRDNKEEMEIIKGIINDPSPIFDKSLNIIKEIISEIGNQYISTINDILELPEEQREKLFKENQPELTEKEKKKIELQKQLEDLDKEDKIIE